MVLRDQKFLTENGDTRPSSFLNSSRYKKVLGRQAVSSTRSFGTVTDEKQSTKKCATRPFFIIKIFDTRNFLKHRRVPPRNVSALRDKNNFDGKSCYALPLLSLSLSQSRSIVTRRKFPLRNVLVLWDQKVLTEIRDTRPFSFLNSSRYQKVLGGQKGSSTKCYDTLRDRNWSAENFESPLFYQKSYRSRIFPKHWTVRLRRVMLLWEQKVSTKNHDNRLLSFPQHFLIPKKFLEDRRVSLPKDSVLWDKTISAENRDTTYLIYRYFFPIPEILWNRKLPLPTVSVLWDQKVSTEDRDSRPLFNP